MDDHAYSCDGELETARSSPDDGRNSPHDGEDTKDSVYSVKLVKKVNSTSNIWLFFGFPADKHDNAVDNGKPQCRTCFKEISCRSGNTTNLFKHLRARRPSQYGKAGHILSTPKWLFSRNFSISKGNPIPYITHITNCQPSPLLCVLKYVDGHKSVSRYIEYSDIFSQYLSWMKL